MALLTAGCNKDLTIEMPAPDPMAEKVLIGEAMITDQNSGDLLFSTTYSSGEVMLDITLPTAESTITVVHDSEDNLYANLLSRLKKQDKFGQYTLLPQENATIEIRNGATADQKVAVVTLKEIEKLPYAIYLLPVVLDIDGEMVAHFVKVPLMGSFLPLSEHNQKPLPPGTDYKEPIKLIAYVETNDYDPRNIANFVLKDSKLPVFDMIVLFAANMNYDASQQRRVLFFNDKLQPMVENPDVFFKPIRDRGIKLIMDILPNHHGVGYLNFQSYEEALDFAGQMKEWSDKAQIDGWDVDEEYAEYYKLPNYPYVDESSLWFLRAARETMPNTILTHYEYNSPFDSYSTDDQGKKAIDYLDYSWTDYNVTGSSQIGMPNDRYGNRSIQASYGGLRQAESVAQSTIDEKLGLLMIFNMTVSKDNYKSFENSLSEITQKFYGEDCVYAGPHFIGPKGI